MNPWKARAVKHHQQQSAADRRPAPDQAARDEPHDVTGVRADGLSIPISLVRWATVNDTRP